MRGAVIALVLRLVACKKLEFGAKEGGATLLTDSKSVRTCRSAKRMRLEKTGKCVSMIEAFVSGAIEYSSGSCKGSGNDGAWIRRHCKACVALDIKTETFSAGVQQEASASLFPAGKKNWTAKHVLAFAEQARSHAHVPFYLYNSHDGVPLAALDSIQQCLESRQWIGFGGYIYFLQQLRQHRLVHRKCFHRVSINEQTIYPWPTCGLFVTTQLHVQSANVMFV
jgi:hypothetical protein